MDQGELVQESHMELRALIGECVTLRFLCSDHISEYLNMFSPTVCHWLHADQESESLYLAQQLIAQAQGATYFFCIFDRESDRLIGGIEIRESIHRGQLYAWMHEDYWGTGLYQEALALAARFYFMMTGASFFTAHVDVHNKRSYHALRKMNFAPSGIIQGPHGKQHVMLLRNTACSVRLPAGMMDCVLAQDAQ